MDAGGGGGARADVPAAADAGPVGGAGGAGPTLSPDNGTTKPIGTGGVTGAGGMAGTGGMGAVDGGGGTAGAADAPVAADAAGPGADATDGSATNDGPSGDGAPAVSCTDPEYPQPCPARNGAPAVCARVTADCTSLTLCGATPVACRKGQQVNCAYPTNYCGPAGNKCPSDNDPSRTLYCPAANGVGPLCASPDVDCTTVTSCGADGLLACPKGYEANCKYKLNPCSPIDKNKCPPEKPKFCPAIGNVGPDCYLPDVDCSSITICGDMIDMCGGTGYYIDCKKDIGSRCTRR
jgi:hypothetical protein